MLPMCVHCDREVPPAVYPTQDCGARPQHRVCGGCRGIVCVRCPDCGPEEEI